MKKFIVGFALVFATFVLLGAQGVEHSRGNLSSNFLFNPDNTYDIGASAANRPANIFAAGAITAGGTVTTGAAAALAFAGRSRIWSSSDGVMELSNTANTDFTRLQFGGTTSSFPSLKRNTNSLDVRLADDSAYTTITASGFNMSVAGSVALAGVKLLINTAPTISSGFGTSPTIASNNGTAAFTVNVGTGAAATSGVVGLPTATTGWNCFVNDITAAAAHVAYDTRQTASTTTTATFENQTTSTGAAVAWAASDILRVSCFAY